GPPWRFNSSTSRRYVPSSLNLFVSVPSFAPEISASPSCLPSALKRRMNKSQGEPRLRVLPEKTRRWSLAAGNSNQSRSFGLAKRPLTTDVAQLDEIAPGRRRYETEARIGTDCWIVVTVNQFPAGRVEQAHDRVERRAQTIRDDLDRHALAFFRAKGIVIKTRLLRVA